jgi:hypothetical protein
MTKKERKSKRAWRDEEDGDEKSKRGKKRNEISGNICQANVITYYCYSDNCFHLNCHQNVLDFFSFLFSIFFLVTVSFTKALIKVLIPFFQMLKFIELEIKTEKLTKLRLTLNFLSFSHTRKEK